MNRTAGSEWEGRLGETWAGEWRRTDRSFSMLTERLLERSREFAFASVLDIGCGAGELSLAIARGRPQARVLGVDISSDLVAAARERAQNLDNASFVLADAARWQPPEGFAPDLLVSRHGVMFFAEPPAAFAHLHALAAPDARMMFSCFRASDENPWIGELVRVLPASARPAGPPDPHEPGPFAFGERNHVEAILAQGGWRDLAFEAFDFGMVAGAGPDPVGDALDYFLSIGPAAAASGELSDADRAAFAANMRAMLETHLTDGLIVLRAAAWIVTAHKA